MKNILITGGSDGLGKALANYFCKNNKVIIVSENPQKLKQTTLELERSVEGFICDVSNVEQVKTTVEKIIKKYKTIDVLINNAGLQIQGALIDSDYDRINKVINVNLTGVINVTKAVLSYMKNNKCGTIINVNSQAGLYSKAERTVYHASKWGVTGFTKCLQPEASKFGVRVTDLLPGKMKTNTFKNMGIEKSMDDAVDTIYVCKAVDFIINLPNEVHIPELGIKHILN